MVDFTASNRRRSASGFDGDKAGNEDGRAAESGSSTARGGTAARSSISDATFSPQPLSLLKAHHISRPKPAIAAFPSGCSQLRPILFWEKHRPGEGVFPIVGLERLLDRCHHDLAFL
jgi:hypothetical protein